MSVKVPSLTHALQVHVCRLVVVAGVLLSDALALERKRNDLVIAYDNGLLLDAATKLITPLPKSGLVHIGLFRCYEKPHNLWHLLLLTIQVRHRLQI